MDVTYFKDIKPLFREKDVTCMQERFNLYSYDDVSKYADAIYQQVSTYKMPEDGPWTDDKIKLFKEWMDTGKQEGTQTSASEREAFYKVIIENYK